MPYSPRSPRSPRYDNSRATRTITDLMGQGGAIRAQREVDKGDIWGNAFRELGQIAGGAVQAHQQRKSAKQQAEQDAAFVGRLTEWSEANPHKPPPLAMFQEVYGLEEGMSAAKAFMGFREAAAATQERNQGRLVKGVQQVFKNYKVFGEPIVAEGFGALAKMINGSGMLGPDMQVDPEYVMQNLAELERVFAEEIPEEFMKVGKNERVVSASDPSQVVLGAAPEPEKPLSIEQQYAAAVASGNADQQRELLFASAALADSKRAPEGPPDPIKRRMDELRLEKAEWEKKVRESDTGEGDLKLSVQAIDKISGIDQSLQIIEAMETQLKSAKGRGEEWIGPLKGRVTEFGIMMPDALQPGQTGKELASFYANGATLLNSVVKAITGAQMSEPEAKRIRKQVPLMTDKDVLWDQKAKATVKNLTLLRDRIVQLSRGQTPDWGGPPEEMDAEAAFLAALEEE